MDVDGVNPMALTLDEVIQLNRFRNKVLDEQPSSSNTQIKKEPSDIVNGHDDEELTTTIQTKLRETENGSVFDRLGWKKPKGYARTNNQQALRAIRQARQFKHRNLRVVNTNTGMRPPLTANVLRRHNQLPGNFTVKRLSSPGSVYSMSSISSRPTMIRHSLKKCLDPQIQKLLQNMINDSSPAVVTSNTMGQLVVDHKLLNSFTPPSHCTSIPTHIRFALND